MSIAFIMCQSILLSYVSRNNYCSDITVVHRRPTDPPNEELRIAIFNCGTADEYKYISHVLETWSNGYLPVECAKPCRVVFFPQDICWPTDPLSFPLTSYPLVVRLNSILHIQQLSMFDILLTPIRSFLKTCDTDKTQQRQFSIKSLQDLLNLLQKLIMQSHSNLAKDAIISNLANQLRMAHIANDQLSKVC